MALSGSTNFSVNASEMVSASLRVLNVVGQGRVANASEIADGLQALNMLLKRLHGDGMSLHLTKTKSLALVASTASYLLGPGSTVAMSRPTSIVSAKLRDASNIDVELTEMSEAEYLGIPNKTLTGIPSSYYYDPQLTNGVFYTWPCSDTATAVAHTVQIRYTKPIDDMDTVSDDFEIPQEWYEPVKLLLAVSVAPEYDSVPIRKLEWLAERGEYLKNQVLGMDNETTSVTFSPA